jgi:hypothetical protein
VISRAHRSTTFDDISRRASICANCQLPTAASWGRKDSSGTSEIELNLGTAMRPNSPALYLLPTQHPCDGMREVTDGLGRHR